MNQDLNPTRLRYEAGFVLLFLVSVYKVPFYCWCVYTLGVLLGVHEIHTLLHMGWAGWEGR